MGKLKPLLLISLLTLTVTCSAGWVLTGRYIDQEGRTIMQRWFIQDQKVKFEQYNIIYTINFVTGDIILVDPELLIFYKANITDYIDDYKKYWNDKLNLLISRAGKEKNEEILASYRKATDAFGEPKPDCPDSLSFQRMQDTLIVFGAPTEKYQLRVNGIKTEEIWISTAVNVNRQFSWKLYNYYLSLIEPNSASPCYESAGLFLSLLDKGFPVRRIMIRDGYKTESQVSREERRDIPDYEFYIPDLCKQVPLKQWLEREGVKKTEYDDYE
jgi:hypothetical protein